MSEKSLVQDIIELREKVAEYERQYDEDTEDMARAIVLYETLKTENERLSIYEGMSEKLADENIRYREALKTIEIACQENFPDDEIVTDVRRTASNALEDIQ